MDATKVDTQIMELQAQGESFSRAMDMEFQREAQLTQEIKDVREEVMELRRSCKIIKCYDQFSDGNDFRFPGPGFTRRSSETRPPKRKPSSQGDSR